MFSSIYDSVSEHCTPQGVVDDVASNTSASSSSHLHNHCRWVEKKYEGMTRWSDSHEDGEATHSMSSCNSSMASEPHNAEEMHPNIGNNIMCSSSSNNTTISTSVVDDDEEEKDDEEEAYIPIDYDEELEDCSQYTFSKDSVVWGTSLTGEGCNAEENEKDVAGFHVNNSYDDVDPFSVSWWHQSHTADESHLPPSPSRYQAELSDADACQGLRLLLREACRNNMLQIKHTPSYAFGPDYDDGDAAFLPATHQSGTQRKLAYLCKTRQEWQQLACHMTSELDRCPSNHRALLSALSNLSIFSNDHHCILRELSSAKAEEARRARRERAEQIISTLKTQQRLFLLPVLRAYEEEPATEVPLTQDVVAASVMMKMEEVEEDVVCSLTATPSDRSPACTSHRLSSPYSSFPGLSDEDLIHVEARAMSGGGGSFLLYEVEASGAAAAAGAGRMHGAEMYSWITNNVDYPSLTTSMSEGRLGLSGRLGVSGRRGLDCSGRSNWSSRRPSSGLLGAFVEVSESAGLFRAPSCTSSLEEICPSPVGMEEEAEEGWGMWSLQKDAGTSSSTEQHNHCNFPMFCGAR